MNDSSANKDEFNSHSHSNKLKTKTKKKKKKRKKNKKSLLGKRNRSKFEQELTENSTEISKKRKRKKLNTKIKRKKRNKTNSKQELESDSIDNESFDDMIDEESHALSIIFSDEHSSSSESIFECSTDITNNTNTPTTKELSTAAITNLTILSFNHRNHFYDNNNNANENIEKYSKLEEIEKLIASNVENKKFDPNFRTLADIIKDRKSGIPMDCKSDIIIDNKSDIKNITKNENESVSKNIENEENTETFHCQWCKQSSTNIYQHTRHEKKPHIWNCNYCEMQFLNNFELKEHQSEKHTKRGKMFSQMTNDNNNNFANIENEEIILVNNEFQFNSSLNSIRFKSDILIKENIKCVQRTMLSTVDAQNIKKDKINCGSFLKKNEKVENENKNENKKNFNRKKKWEKWETRKFYKCLASVGMNFLMMEMLYNQQTNTYSNDGIHKERNSWNGKYRSSKNLRDKYLKEDKKNSNFISKLLSKVKFDDHLLAKIEKYDHRSKKKLENENVLDVDDGISFDPFNDFAFELKEAEEKAILEKKLEEEEEKWRLDNLEEQQFE